MPIQGQNDAPGRTNGLTGKRLFVLEQILGDDTPIDNRQIVHTIASEPTQTGRIAKSGYSCG
jgi:hypothetical protein